MSTDVKSHHPDIELLRYSSGNGKTNLQVTMKRDWKEKGDRNEIDKYYDDIFLTREQAAALAADLQDFAQGRELVIIGGNLVRDSELNILE